MRRALPALVVPLIACSSATAGKGLVPIPIGAGAPFHPTATNPSVERGATIGSLRCVSGRVARMGIHLELFARGRVVIVPAGVGMAPPLRRQGAIVASGRCSYPVRTREPTGVVEVVRSPRTTLGDFFVVWGEPFGQRRLVGFRTAADDPVRAYVDGRRWAGGLRAIPLREHAEIVLELGRYIPPHTAYRFPSDSE